jgi:hypothetical protein
MRSILLSHWGPLVLLAAVESVILSLYVVLGASPSPLQMTLLPSTMAFFMMLWVLEDAHRQQGFPCYDFGFFVALGFPLSVVWYLLWTRGFRGWLVIGMFVALYFMPWLFAIAVWVVTTASNR